jgi:hypothetical protein
MKDHDSSNHIPDESTLRRSGFQKIIDFISFPLRAITLFHYDRFSLSSRATERFDYVAREVTGRCLDVGSDTSIAIFHDLLQIAVDSSDFHLHRFGHY